MIELLDTHQHLLYRNELTYEWADNLPQLSDRDFTLSDYRQLTVDHHVAATLFMEVDASNYHHETRFISDFVHDPTNNLVGVISSCRPETNDGFDEWLEECADLPVVGFRRILHEVPDEMSRADTFRQNVRKFGDKGHVFDMVFRADQLPIAHQLASVCDDMTLVLDHCGVPDIAGGQNEDWKANIAALAKLPHVCAKLSGVLAYCAPGQATLEAVKPYTDHVVNCFGPDRLVWGSDWPVVNLNSDLPSWIQVFRNLIADLSDAEQENICHKNAQRLYHIKR